MIIVGIDPGTTQSAVVIYDTATEEILGHGKYDNVDAMLAFAEGGTVVCEMVQSFGMPVGAEVFQTVLWVGRYCEYCRWVGASFHMIYRQEIKTTLCQSVKANDAAIRQRLIDLLGPPGKKKTPGKTYGLAGDEWQALAVCVAFSKRKEQRV
jgi:hypothetical protein